MKLDPRVRELVESVVARQELELVHVEMAGGRSLILQVYIDKPGGVTVDDCAKVSERLSLHLMWKITSHRNTRSKSLRRGWIAGCINQRITSGSRACPRM